jgi:putative SOS response-associated peptidase YedK
MCGRYASFLPAEAVARLIQTVNPMPNFPPTWNIAPTRDAMACVIIPRPANAIWTY